MVIIANTRVIIPNLEGRILLLQRASKTANGLWNLPGGKVDSGVYMNDTCENEVDEETGLIIKNPEFLFYLEEPNSLHDGRHYLSFYFLAKGYGGNVRLNEESSAFDWVNPKTELDNYQITFGNDLGIRKYLMNH